jgi:hypothetical protein
MRGCFSPAHAHVFILVQIRCNTLQKPIRVWDIVCKLIITNESLVYFCLSGVRPFPALRVIDSHLAVFTV